jgi:hypothetical protein
MDALVEAVLHAVRVAQLTEEVVFAQMPIEMILVQIAHITEETFRMACNARVEISERDVRH